MKILEILDKLICKYIGFNEQGINVDTLRKSNNDIILINTEPFKRHTYHEHLEEFMFNNFSKINEDMKKQIGISMGKY